MKCFLAGFVFATFFSVTLLAQPFSLELGSRNSKHLLVIKGIEGKKSYEAKIFFGSKLVNFYEECNWRLGAPEGLEWSLKCGSKSLGELNVSGQLENGRIEVTGE